MTAQLALAGSCRNIGTMECGAALQSAALTVDGLADRATVTQLATGRMLMELASYLGASRSALVLQLDSLWVC